MRMVSLRIETLGVHGVSQGCSEFGSKKNFSTVGGPRYDFWSFFKIKLKPGRNGYHSTTFGMPNHIVWIERPSSCQKNLTPKGHFRAFFDFRKKC